MQRIAFICLLLLSVGAHALSLDDAKRSGWVGEQPNGYLGLIDSDQLEAAKLITTINKKRKAKYQAIANKQNTSLENIEALAGEKLIKRSIAEGLRYATPGGDWK